MADQTFKLTFDGKPLSDIAARLGERFQRRDYLARIGQRWMLWARDNFARFGIERPWPALDPDTLQDRSAGAGALRGRTGKLGRSFGIVVKASGTVETVTLRNFARHAHLHHFGVKPHAIEPRASGMRGRGSRARFVVGKRFMVFPVAGGMAFARRVNHRGIPARALLPTTQLGQELASETLDAYVTEAVRASQGGA